VGLRADCVNIEGMTAALIQSPTNAESPARKHFTRAEFDRLMESEIFEGQRYELINGDLIDKMGQNPPHAFCLVALLKWLTELFGMDKLRAQLPIEVGERDRPASFPGPDVAVIIETLFQFRSVIRVGTNCNCLWKSQILR
jgi:Uma2 family endonuclease